MSRKGGGNDGDGDGGGDGGCEGGGYGDGEGGGGSSGVFGSERNSDEEFNKILKYLKDWRGLDGGFEEYTGVFKYGSASFVVIVAFLL